MPATPETASLAVRVTVTLLVYQPLVPAVPDRLTVVLGLTLSILTLSDSAASVLPALSTLKKVMLCVPFPVTEKVLPV